MNSFVFLQLLLICIFTLNLWLHLTSRGEALEAMALKGWWGAAFILVASSAFLVVLFWSFGASEEVFTSLPSPLPVSLLETLATLMGAGAAVTIVGIFGKALLFPRRAKGA